jgi:hypothetical protein
MYSVILSVLDLSQNIIILDTITIIDDLYLVIYILNLVSYFIFSSYKLE